MRPFRAIGLLAAGALAGFTAAAAVLKRALPSRGDAASDEVRLVAVFNGVSVKSRAQAFRGGFVLAWFGGIAVRVPPGWRVRSRLKTLFGGAKVRVPEPDQPEAPTLTLEGFALFGGIAVAARDAAEA